jgi:hypothetical protein
MAQQVLLSPEKYIRTKARALPIYECMISSGWRDAGIASIFVARKHNNGNVTYGSYLVDIWCLGLKHTHCQFNADISDWNKIKDEHEMGQRYEPVDYNLAHNIIFGGIEFAEDYGFKPHKDFSLSQFILEEDDERIPIIDVEFGVEGKPHIVAFAEDYKAQMAFKYLQANYSTDEYSFSTT